MLVVKELPVPKNESLIDNNTNKNLSLLSKSDTL